MTTMQTLMAALAASPHPEVRDLAVSVEQSADRDGLTMRLTGTFPNGATCDLAHHVPTLDFMEAASMEGVDPMLLRHARALVDRASQEAQERGLVT